MFIYPYKVESNSVKSLKNLLGAKIIKLENSNFKGKANKFVINWGNSNPNLEVEKCVVVNSPEKIARVTNKQTFFEFVEGKVRIPEFTLDINTAKKWCEEGSVIIVREVLQGHSGVGIVVIEDLVEFESYNHERAKLYVKYIPKKKEYRVHIVNGQPILVQRKAKRNDLPNNLVNWRVRNHNNGFVFVKNEGEPIPDDVITQANLAIDVCELDFGAVDVVWNEYKQQAFVLEINTAPGLDGTTPDTYVEALKAYVDMLGGMGEETHTHKSRSDQWKKLVMDNPFSLGNAMPAQLAQPMHIIDDPLANIEEDDYSFDEEDYDEDLD